MIEHRALGVWTAERDVARVETFVGQTSLVCVAILVGSTAERTNVVQAYVSEETVVVQATGEQAIAFDAFLVEGALVVGETSW